MHENPQATFVPSSCTPNNQQSALTAACMLAAEPMQPHIMAVTSPNTQARLVYVCTTARESCVLVSPRLRPHTLRPLTVGRQVCPPFTNMVMAKLTKQQ